MENKVKESYIEELKSLLAVWHALPFNPNSTQRDYIRVTARIREVCGALDAIDRAEVVQ